MAIPREMKTMAENLTVTMRKGESLPKGKGHRSEHKQNETTQSYPTLCPTLSSPYIG